MAFAVRCPECRAKLKLDVEPEPDESVECPRCGNHFDATTARMTGDNGTPGAGQKPKKSQAGTATKEPKTKKKKTKAGGTDGQPKKRKAKKKKQNMTVLALMLGGAFVILACVGGMAYFLLSKSGKMQEMLTCVPAECNIVRGVNTGHVTKYVVYKPEADRMIAGPLRSGWDEIAQGLGLPPEEADYPEYAVIAKSRAGGTGTVMVYRTRAAIPDTSILGSALGGDPEPIGGQTAYRLGNSGSLAQSIIYAPTNRIIVVILPGPKQASLAQASVAGRQNPEQSFYGQMGATGQKVSSGNMWAIIRAQGDLTSYIQELVKPVAPDFSSLNTQAERSKTFGVWTSFGARGITFGAAMECDSVEAAEGLVQSLRDGPMGKQEDQPEIPNSLKSAYGTIRSKEFSEFLSNLKYYSKNECAWLESRMNQKEKAMQALTTFANPMIGEGR
jgi:hypothetical protein